MFKSFSNFQRDERGATMVEYGIAVVLAITVGTASLIALASQINTNIYAATDELADR